ncbi:2-hydroxyacid dehydrogenase [Solitalea canadensis]|uniref:Lactate dehydrogenase-like oxidoreductase n=1 Tax=Solitalea canadensis (strain ATCC 29591 / DSM 3403 / JCM 21819 / LMG 8368 / NBRC 15130 / NCIMB 12057 / USAM 9D) TaxID=929556 RepID=H8KQD7_SOLCM|nr:2-hydroxyacid dehydrogenase [Solitalea canadensis]AFD06553.1 lactate dehydrogenase-like oxidoreductase [Solitalea canadensis DSM 3403]
MKVIVFSTREFEKKYLISANTTSLELVMVTESLSLNTVHLAKGAGVVCIFTGDDASAPVLVKLKEYNIKYIAVRATGFDHVDLKKAAALGITVANVPDYSPFSIAEHAIGLMLALIRKLTLAYQQTQRYNFKIDNLLGSTLHHKTVGIVGTGKIGSAVTQILSGFDCNLIGYDKIRNEQLISKYQLHYADLKTLCKNSDIITLHLPLNERTEYLINKEMIDFMRQGVMIINTARGGIVNTQDIIEGIEKGKIGYYGADVYEHEKDVFFYDHSEKKVNDPLLKKLLSYSNVLITPHQAFATKEALNNIAVTIFKNINCWALQQKGPHELHPDLGTENDNIEQESLNLST